MIICCHKFHEEKKITSTQATGDANGNREKRDYSSKTRERRSKAYRTTASVELHSSQVPPLHSSPFLRRRFRKYRNFVGFLFCDGVIDVGVFKIDGNRPTRNYDPQVKGE